MVRITDHQSKHTSEDYLKTFYKTWDEVRTHKFDGFIITGAPIAHIPFEEVRYWPEMVEIMNWTLRLAAEQAALPKCPPQPADKPATARGKRAVYDAANQDMKDVSVYHRAA